MAVSVIVSNFNGAKYLPRLLETLKVQMEVTFEIIIVDRNSTDESANILALHPDVKVVKEPPESGLVAGYHAGVSCARYEHLFFCNEDMWFAPDCLARLEEQIDLSRKVACADPWQWSYDGLRVIHSAPQIRRGWNRSEIHPFYSHQQNQQIPVGHIVAGACAGAMMIHRFAYEDVGGWDTSFFLDYEDTDIEIRLWQRGWLTTIVPKARVYHAVGASNSKAVSAGKVRVSEKRYIHDKSNQIIAAWKTFSLPYCWLPVLAWLEAVIRDILKLRGHRVVWDFRAVFLTLRRLPVVLQFRRLNAHANHHRPGERFFKEPNFQFGAVVKPPVGFPKDQNGNPAIRLSIALVTRNRPTWLRQCLESWRSQSLQPFEIVVSDDSGPEYVVEIQRIANEFGCRYVKGPCRGLYANRNNAALACQGTHIMSADDDHTHPLGFTQAVVETVAQDPDRVWIFSERHTKFPEAPLACPAELAPHGGGRTPSDPSNCQAIACGSSVFPRRIFDVDLRYEEAYPMGAIWYLWGVVIAKAGFRISYSDSTFVWHHAVDSDSDRARNPAFTRSYLECMTFVSFVNALAFNPILLPLTLAYGVKRVLVLGSICGTTAPSRLGLRELWRAWIWALRAARSTTDMLMAVETNANLPTPPQLPQNAFHQ